MKRCTSGSACSWHGHCTCYVQVFVTTLVPDLLYSLSCVRSDTPALKKRIPVLFITFVGVFVLIFVCKRRRFSGSTTYKIQPRRHGGIRHTWRALQLIARLYETRMHRTSTLVLGNGLAFARSISWNGLLGVFALPESLHFHRSCHSQRLFFQDAP